jgi:hypothetical protein
MPIAFIAIGALFLIAAVRGTITDYPSTSGGSGTQPGLLTLLKADFVSTSASGNFLIWLVTLWIIGALGYIPGFRPIANALLFLVVLVLFLSNSKNSGTGGIFAEFNAALTSNGSASATGNITGATSALNIPVSQGGIGPIQPMSPSTTGVNLGSLGSLSSGSIPSDLEGLL